MFAEEFGCEVVGVDLTAEFVNVGECTYSALRPGGSDLANSGKCSALDLPFPKAEFDAATLIHVGMNIADKAKLLSLEVRRVLADGTVFGVYRVMRIAEGDLPYPMPWAQTPETSFVERRRPIGGCSERPASRSRREHDRRELALRLGREMRERAAARGPSPLGPHLLMGPAAPQRVGNVMAAVERGLIAPVEIIVRAG